MRRTICFAVAIVAMLAVSFARAAEPEKMPDGTLKLFDGKDLAGWEGDPKVWSVEDGAITGQTSAQSPIKKNTFLIWRAGTVKDFELRLKFRMESGNTGVQYRSKDKGDFVVNGYQADFDFSKTYAGILYEEGGRGILANIGQQVVIGPDGKVQVTGKTADPKEIRASIKDKDWNDYVIVAKGNHLTHTINGKVTADITDDQEAKRAFEGIVALQVHAGPPMKVQFKDVYLKVLNQ